MKKIKVLSIIGTRPEVIKMAPIIHEIQKRQDKFEQIIVSTGQHREMVTPYFELFSIQPDYDLGIMIKNQTPDTVVASIISKLPTIYKQELPNIVLVQGDTSSAFASALTAFHNKLSIGHVEAGLRTGNKYNPFPEEINRHLIGTLADLHFAPTTKTKLNLIKEGIDAEKVFITGNTVIDSLLSIVKDEYEFSNNVLKQINFDVSKIIAVTAHRRESFGKPLKNIFLAIKEIVHTYSDIEIVFPVHYNPNVRELVSEILNDVKNVHLIEPLPYQEFVQLLNKAYIILTDSGGIQEEAPSLAKPVLVMRETTERPEGIEAGTAALVGTAKEDIVAAVRQLIDDKKKYQKMAHAVNPYGDGKASIRIIDIIQSHFSSI